MSSKFTNFNKLKLLIYFETLYIHIFLKTQYTKNKLKNSNFAFYFFFYFKP